MKSIKTILFCLSLLIFLPAEPVESQEVNDASKLDLNFRFKSEYLGLSPKDLVSYEDQLGKDDFDVAADMRYQVDVQHLSFETTLKLKLKPFSDSDTFEIGGSTLDLGWTLPGENLVWINKVGGPFWDLNFSPLTAGVLSGGEGEFYFWDSLHSSGTEKEFQKIYKSGGHFISDNEQSGEFYSRIFTGRGYQTRLIFPKSGIANHSFYGIHAEEKEGVSHIFVSELDKLIRNQQVSLNYSRLTVNPTGSLLTPLESQIMSLNSKGRYTVNYDMELAASLASSESQDESASGLALIANINHSTQRLFFLFRPYFDFTYGYAQKSFSSTRSSGRKLNTMQNTTDTFPNETVPAFTTSVSKSDMYNNYHNIFTEIGSDLLKGKIKIVYGIQVPRDATLNNFESTKSLNTRIQDGSFDYGAFVPDEYNGNNTEHSIVDAETNVNSSSKYLNTLRLDYYFEFKRFNRRAKNNLFFISRNAFSSISEDKALIPFHTDKQMYEDEIIRYVLSDQTLTFGLSQKTYLLFNYGLEINQNNEQFQWNDGDFRVVEQNFGIGLESQINKDVAIGFRVAKQWYEDEFISGNKFENYYATFGIKRSYLD